MKILKEEDRAPGGCNCSGRLGPCPLNGECLTRSVVYRADIEDEDNNIQTYTGLTSRAFKSRFYEHRNSINHRPSENSKSTTLSTHIWKLKDRDKSFDIKWQIIGKAKSFNPTTKRCNLCLKEKFFIIFKPEGASLNQRSELFSTCRHRNIELLESI